MLRTEEFQVTMADVDAAGIIYFASPLRWAERMSTGWLRQIGRPLLSLFGDGITIPAVAVHVNYRSHVSLDDTCRLTLSAASTGTTSFTFRCETFVGDAETAAVECLTTHVYTQFGHPAYADARTTSKQPLPGWLREPLELDLRHQDDATSAPSTGISAPLT
ncbi:MAG TPA: thioesterase family protein [Pseudonocardiaceae bacterium]|jgi:YbgC/YbaW family acyl-CoA thioester hydrolase